MSDLSTAKRITLTRVENGWIVQNHGNVSTGSIDGDKPIWVFASTASLCRALPKMIGESGWEVKPERDSRGHFKPVKKDLIPSVIFKQS